MAQFEITISYSKIIDAADKADAQVVIDRIERESNLDGEYGPFSSLDVFTEVEEVKE